MESSYIDVGLKGLLEARLRGEDQGNGDKRLLGLRTDLQGGGVKNWLMKSATGSM